MISTHHKFNVVFLGDAGVGKTSFIRKHQTGHFPQEYKATKEVQCYALPWNTTAGYLDVTVWEIPGGTELSAASKEALKRADAAFIMFDVCNKKTLDNVKTWARMSLSPSSPQYTPLIGTFIVGKLCAATHDSLPTVICGSKTDKAEGHCYNKPEGIQHEYHDVSVVTTSNFDEPWLYVFRQLLQVPDIEHVTAGCCPPHKPVSALEAIQIRTEMEKAAAEPLPDEKKF